MIRRSPCACLRVPARACVQAPHFHGFAAGWRKNADMTSEQDPRARQHLPERELDPSQEQARSQTLMQRAGMDREHIVDRITDVNDGIISTAGIVEGFSGAGLGGTTIVVAAASALIAGSIAIASGKGRVSGIIGLLLCILAIGIGSLRLMLGGGIL